MIENQTEKRSSSAIRVSLMDGGSSGPFLGLSMDEVRPQDTSFEFEGLTFIMDTALFKECGDINIDFIEAGSNSGFKITAANPICLEEDKGAPETSNLQGVCH